jgi:predicted cobalt transporter CbtA
MGGTCSPFPATSADLVVSAYLRRGLAAGLLAGLLAGLFAFFVGEPLLDRAIAIEEASGGAHHDEEKVFSRPTQKAGLFFATGLFGVTVGGVFGLAFAFFRGRLAADSDFKRSVYLTAALFAGAFLIPFLKYPANPPAVGDPETIGARTAAYFTLVTLSLLLVLAAWLAARVLRERGADAPRRRVIVGAGMALAVAALFFALPAAPSARDFPAGLLWGFRLSSFGTQLVFWAGLGVVFGLLCERANRGGVTT